MLGPENWPVDWLRVGQGLMGFSKNPEVEVHFEQTYSPRLVQVQYMLGLYVYSNSPVVNTRSCPLRTPCTMVPCGLLFYVSLGCGQF